MKIVIIGAGLGGLAAAIALRCETDEHEVLVLESARELAETTQIGAGLQVTPNATRLLQRWGIGPACAAVAAIPSVISIHRYSDGSLLGHRSDFGAEMETKYGAGYWDMHRADLQRVMYGRAVELGVEFRFGASVAEHDFSRETCGVTLATKAHTTSVNGVNGSIADESDQTGERIKCDLIVAADGLWSKTRAAFLSGPSPPIPTGDLAYRIVLHTDEITDPEIREWVNTARVCLWAGPGSHVVFYPLRANKMVNIVCLCPDTLPNGVSRMEGDMEELHAIFEKWDPKLNKFLRMVDKVDKWKLMHLAELDAWTNPPDSTVVFLGDACHPMLPYMAQGAGSALEDGATLGVLLSKAPSLTRPSPTSARRDDGPTTEARDRKELTRLLGIYEALRKPRSSYLQKGSMKQRHNNHLPDGPEQRERDELAQSMLYDQKEGYPFYWLDPDMQGKVYAYDCYEELRKVGIDC